MKVVLCHGVFDILHVGHVRQLRAAREMGDWLIVSICSDAHVRDAKGPGRPVNRQEYRQELLQCLEFVDEVVITEGLGVAATVATIERIRPDVYVKGREYEGRLADAEMECVERVGGRVIFIDEFDKAACSSSELIVRAST